MPKKPKNLKPRVLFNASVILAGLYSSSGGSAKILYHVKRGRIRGVISEVILDEVGRHTHKFNFDFLEIVPPPNEKIVRKYNRVVIDEGDAHVLATCEEEKIRHLVTLDKKHLLVLQGKIKGLTILTPGELIMSLRR